MRVLTNAEVLRTIVVNNVRENRRTLGQMARFAEEKGICCGRKVYWCFQQKRFDPTLSLLLFLLDFFGYELCIREKSRLELRDIRKLPD